MTLARICGFAALAGLMGFLMAAKPDRGTARKIESVMKRMSKPQKAIKKLERAKLFTSKDFKKNIALLAKESKNMLRIKHPEAEFNTLSKELDKELKKLIALLGKKDNKAIKKQWGVVKNNCYECHDTYKED